MHLVAVSASLNLTRLRYMPAYGSTASPSLKMESGYGNGYTGQRASSFSVGRIIGDPFALATISIGIVSAHLLSAAEAVC